MTYNSKNRKKYYQRDKDKIKQYYLKNIEKIKNYRKEWYKENKNKVLLNNKLAQDKKKNFIL